MRITVAENSIALCIAAIGATLATWIEFPAPLLTGAAMAVTFASIGGVRSSIAPPLQTMAFVLIGIAMGGTITPEVLSAAGQWSASFALLGITIVAILWICPWVLSRFWRLDNTTAFLASSPGHLSFVLSLTINSSANIPVVSVIQSIRVLMLTVTVPWIVTLLGFKPTALPGADQALPWVEFLPILAGALALGRLAKSYRIPAAYLLTGMAISGLAHATGVASGGLHPLVASASIVVMGAILGTRFSGVDRKTLLEGLTAGLCITLMVLFIAAITAGIFSLASGLPLAQLLIAFAPGGVEAMAAMALMLDADPAFVAAHHAWRLVVISLIVPLWLHRLQARSIDQ